MDALDGEGFVEAVRSFLTVLYRWRELALNWRGAVEDGTAKGPDGADAPDDSFLSLHDEQIVRI